MRKFYSRILTILCVFFSINAANAQLTGTKLIPGNYSTIAEAVTALNAQGVGAGGVVFSVAADHAEVTDVPVITATGTVSNPIVFEKSGSGANPLVTRLTPGTVASSTTPGNNGDGIIIINGGDYITFDGIDLQTDPSFSAAGMMEYGYYLKKASGTNASKNVTISNCTVTLNKAARYSAGIFVSNISGTTTVTVTSTGGRSENIRINGNTVRNAYVGIHLRGFNHTASPYDFYDQNNEVGVTAGNTIIDYGGGASAAYGVYGIYQNNVKVMNNSITGGSGNTSTLYGIFLSTGTASNVDITGNTIQLTSSATTSNVYGITNDMGASGTSNTVNITNNIIQDLSWTTATTGDFYGIDQGATAMTINISGNMIRNNTQAGTSAISYYIYNSNSAANGSVNIFNNAVYNNSNPGTGSVYGIYSNPVATTDTKIYSNSVYSLSSNGGIIYGINKTTGNQTDVYLNKVYDLSSSGAGGDVYGLYGTTGTTNNFYNNIVGDLRTPDANTTNALVGLYLNTGTNANAYFNTIYLNGSSSGSPFGSSGIYSASNTPVVTLKNNIVVNTSTASGTGLTAAFRRGTTDLSNYSSSSNNNIWFAGTPSPSNVIYTDGTNTDETLAAFQFRVLPAESASKTEMPPFLSTVGSAADFLHIDPAVATYAESGGTPVAGITTDFDGDTRHATKPDIGADELAGTPVPGCSSMPTPGDIIGLTLICSGASADLTLTGQTVQNGVTYQWQSSATSGSGFTSIPGANGITYNTGNLTATTYYRVMVTCTNTGDAISTPELRLFVNTAPLSGNYTIDKTMPTGGTNFNSFTHAAAALACGVSGAVNFDVAASTYNEQIEILQIPGSSPVNNVTFNGNGATIAFASTANTERSVIRLNGADHVTFNNLVINAAGGTYGWGIHLTGQADSNKIINSTIITDLTATTTNFAGIVASGSLTSATSTGNNANGTLIRNNTFNGGYYGVLLQGVSTGYNLNNTIDSNTINDFYFYGVYGAYQENLLVKNNDISRATRTTGSTFNGVYLTSGLKSAIVDGNRIHNTNDGMSTFTNAAYGVYINGPADAGFETRVYNNIVYNFNNSAGTEYGLYLNDAGIRAWHNSISLEDVAATAGATRGIHIGTYTNVEVRNNVVVVTRGGTGAKFGIYSDGNALVESHNVIYINAPTPADFGYWDVAATATLADWITASGQGVNTMDVDPQYVSPSTGNLYPANTALIDQGLYVGVTRDILNYVRSNPPMPGAYEVPPTIGIDLGVKSLNLPTATGCKGTTETVSVTIKNFSVSEHDFVANPLTVNASVGGAVTQTFTPVTVNTGTLASGDSLVVLITNAFDMSVTGNYIFNATAVVSGDAKAQNDAMPATTITVSPLTAGTASASVESYCNTAGTPTITLSGNAGGDIQWQESTSNGGPWNNVGTVNSTSYTPATSITSTMYYRAESRCGTNTVYSNVVMVEFFNPQVLTTTPGTRCGIGTVDLSATSSPGTTLSWYDSPTGPSIGTGATFTTPVINSTTTYYVGASTGSSSYSAGPATNGQSGTYTLEAGLFFDVIANSMNLNGVYIYPVGTGAGDVVIALRSPSNANLFTTTVNVVGTTAPGVKTFVPLNWTVPNGTGYSLVMLSRSGSVASLVRDPAANHSGFPYTVPGVMSITNGKCCPDASSTSYYYFYDWQISVGCESARTAVTATVTPPPVFTVTDDLAVCNDAVQELRVTSTVADFDNYTWAPQTGLYIDAAATVPYTGVNASIVYLKSSNVGTVKYYANALNSVSNCTNIDSVSVNILPATVSISATIDPICISGSTVLKLDPSSGYTGADIQWLSSSDGVTFTPIGGANATTYTTPSITSTTYYRAEITAGSASCLQATKMVTVNNPQVLTTTPGMRCGTGTVDLAATASPGANLKWYTSATGGTAIGSGTNFTTPSISATTNFYVGADMGTSTSNVGYTSTTGATSGSGTTNFGILFDALAPFTLNSVMVYPVHATAGTPGTVTIEVLDAAGTVVHSATVNVTGNPASSGIGERVDLNFNIAPGTNYKLRPGTRTGVTGLLFGPSSAAPSGGNYGFPFTVPGVLSLTASTLTAAPTNTPRLDLYYYFYDWSVSVNCESPARTAVVATVRPATVFNTHPVSQTYCGTGGITFTAAATGDGTPTYQWYKDGIAISGETADTYTIASPTAADAGAYTVTASACNTVTSNSATLTMGTTTAIGTQPVAQSACEGTTASFTVAATGTNLSYQWRKAGVDIAGATTSTLTLNNVSATDAANYDVVVTGACGTETSTAVALTVNASTQIATQPVSQSACENTNVSFTVAATGTGALTYQWRKNGTDISSATASTFTLNNITSTDAASYDVVVTGDCGTITSAAASLTVKSLTTITSQPVAQMVCAGSSATFTVTATGEGTITYQWRKAGVDIAGANSSSYVIASVSATDAANYDVVVTGDCGSETSVAAALSLNAATVITTEPAAQTFCAGSNVSLTVVATGTGTLSYQWRKGGTDITGATSATLSFTNATASDAGSYDVIVTGDCGAVTSVSATLTLNPGTEISTQPAAQTVCTGANANFSVTATGVGLTYQWRKGGTAITSATTSSLTISNVTASDAGNYDVVVTGTCGSVTSNAAALTVNTCTTVPVIDTDIASVKLMPNVFQSHTLLRVTALRTLKINWTITDMNGRVVMRFDRNVLAGQTDISLQLSHLSGGTYFLSGATDKGRTEVLRFIKF